MNNIRAELVRALMRAYVAMLECHDATWRLAHQSELCAARDALADATGIPAQVIQERCEEWALGQVAFLETQGPLLPDRGPVLGLFRARQRTPKQRSA